MLGASKRKTFRLGSLHLHPHLHAFVFHFVRNLSGHQIVLDSYRTMLDSLDMSKTPRKVMAGFKRRLDRYVDLEMTHCGHEESMYEARKARDRVLVYLATELEKLAAKAGEP